MGFFDLLRRLFFGAPVNRLDNQPEPSPQPGSDQPGSNHRPAKSTTTASGAAAAPHSKTRRLSPLKYRPAHVPTPLNRERVRQRPYLFAPATGAGGYLDLSTDANLELLSHIGLPRLETPAQVADWLGMPLGRLAWLSGRFFENHKPQSEKAAHYHFRWIKKRSGGHRLIEAPKPDLKRVQDRILREILDKADAHPRAFGFVAGRSAILNAAEHKSPYVVLKFDLENFYPSVRYSRVVAIFRTMGFSSARPQSGWLGSRPRPSRHP